MPEMSITKPIVVVDLAKYRIRIHKRTIHILGDPENILLLVNPEERTLGVVCCKKGEKGYHPISLHTLKRKNCFELYSHSLIQTLLNVYPNWKEGEKYRMVGELFAAENVVKFNMSASSPIGNGKNKPI